MDLLALHMTLTTTSSFDIDGTTYHVLPNENNGKDTLHGGPDGWDWVGFRCLFNFLDNNSDCWTAKLDSRCSHDQLRHLLSDRPGWHARLPW